MKKQTLNVTLAAFFMAMGLVLPFFTGQLSSFGNMLLPMHIPVFLCSYICGWQYGLFIGAVTPFFRSFLFSMPKLYPNAVVMACELAVYGFAAGFIYKSIKKKSIVTCYASLVSAMLLGRLVWGAVKSLVFGLAGNSFTFYMFLSGGFIEAVPGVVFQLIFIPMVVNFFEKYTAKKEKLND